MKKGNEGELAPEENETFEPFGDGMSSLTAKVAISHDLRKRLIKEYDLLELNNRGRYYDAIVQTKDGLWVLQLLIDKQSGDIQVVNKKEKK